MDKLPDETIMFFDGCDSDDDGGDDVSDDYSDMENNNENDNNNNNTDDENANNNEGGLCIFCGSSEDNTSQKSRFLHCIKYCEKFGLGADNRCQVYRLDRKW